MLQKSIRALAPVIIAIALCMNTSGTALAQGYEVIDPPQNTAFANKVEVVEYFWLGCPHCYSLEPTIEAWKADKPDHVAFVREAPPMNASWEQHSRGFYAAQIMGLEQPFVEAMFKAIHEDRKPMRKPGDIAELAASVGADADKFEKTMKSFAVETKLRRSMQLAKGAGLSGVPSIVINGKYRTGAGVAGGNEAIIDVIERQVEVEREAMGIESSS